MLSFVDMSFSYFESLSFLILLLSSVHCFLIFLVLNQTRRFRVPYSLFLRLVDLAGQWFGTSDVNAVGKPAAPITLKLLYALKILGRDV